MMKYLRMFFWVFKVFSLYLLAFFCLSNGGSLFFVFTAKLLGDLVESGKTIWILLNYLLFPSIVTVLIIGIIGPFWVRANRFTGFFIAGLISITQIVCGCIALWKSGRVFMLLTIILGAIVAFFLGGHTYLKVFNLRKPG